MYSYKELKYWKVHEEPVNSIFRSKAQPLSCSGYTRLFFIRTLIKYPKYDYMSRFKDKKSSSTKNMGVGLMDDGVTHTCISLNSKSLNMTTQLQSCFPITHLYFVFDIWSFLCPIV